VLIANGTLESANDKNLVPQLINLISDSSPWLMGLLTVCALAAMQSTGAAYMSTFSAMVTRDIYKRYVAPGATDSVQKRVGRITVVLVAGAALVVAAKSTSAIVMLGGLAVAYGFQMYPALMGVCYFPWFTRKGVVAGLVAGLVAVTLTDRTSAWFGLPWGAYPLTIHSAGWGILFNLAIAVIVSKMTNKDPKEKEAKEKRHKFLQLVSGISPAQKRKVSLAWILTIIWFLVGFGPFATIGNTLFSNPNSPATWVPFGLPSLWVWQLLFLVYGIFVMWFLAFKVGLSEPVEPDKVERLHKEYFS
jgi:Na+/proline symporter